MKILEGEVQLVASQDWSVLNNMPIEFGVNVTVNSCDVTLPPISSVVGSETKLTFQIIGEANESAAILASDGEEINFSPQAIQFFANQILQLTIGNDSTWVATVTTTANQTGWSSVYSEEGMQTESTGTVLDMNDGVIDSNNPISFFDIETRSILPLYLNDVLLVDVAFIAEVPSAGTHWMNIGFRVKGTTDIYRSTSIFMTKGVGTDDPMAASFSIPISESLIDQELEIVLTPDVETTVKQKYVCVTRIHKGI